MFTIDSYEKIYNRIRNKNFDKIELVNDKSTNNSKYGIPTFEVSSNNINYKEAKSLIKKYLKINEETNKLKREEVIEAVRILSIALEHIDNDFEAINLLEDLLEGMIVSISDDEVVFISSYKYDEADEFIKTEIYNNNPNEDTFIDFFKKDIYFKITLGEVKTISAFIRCYALAYPKYYDEVCNEILENDIVSSTYFTEEYLEKARIEKEELDKKIEAFEEKYGKSYNPFLDFIGLD